MALARTADQLIAELMEALAATPPFSDGKEGVAIALCVNGRPSALYECGGELTRLRGKPGAMIAGSLARRCTAASRVSIYGRFPTRQLLPRRHFSPLAWYNRQIERAPVITKSITSGGKPFTNT